MNILEQIKELNFENAVKVLDHHYSERYNISDYYEAYSYVCEKFNHQKALLPKKEYRQGL